MGSSRGGVSGAGVLTTTPSVAVIRPNFGKLTPELRPGNELRGRSGHAGQLCLI